MADLVKNLVLEESGQGMAEYSLILAFITLAVIVFLGYLGNGIKGSYQNVVSKFTD